MRVLVTGGAGYIGSHAARELPDAGHRILETVVRWPRDHPEGYGRQG